MYAKKTGGKQNNLRINNEKNKTSARKSKNTAVSKSSANLQKAMKTKMKNTRGFFFFSKILFVVFTVIIIFGLGTNLHKINSKKEELIMLQQEYNSKRIRNEALKQQLDAPVDDEYIINIVKQMGYRKADEIIFYLNSED